MLQHPETSKILDLGFKTHLHLETIVCSSFMDFSEDPRVLEGFYLVLYGFFMYIPVKNPLTLLKIHETWGGHGPQVYTQCESKITNFGGQ